MCIAWLKSDWLTLVHVKAHLAMININSKFGNKHAHSTAEAVIRVGRKNGTNTGCMENKLGSC